MNRQTRQFLRSASAKLILFLGIMSQLLVDGGKTGMNTVDKSVRVRSFHSTTLHLIGFDRERLSMLHAGLDVGLIGVEVAHVVKEVLV